MSGVNKVIVLGNVGQDPDVKTMPSGSIVANLSVATSEKWKDKQTGQQQERTEWHKISAFGKTAEIIEKYVNKGDKLYVEGKLQTRKWQDQSGADRSTTEIIANSVQLLGGSEPQQRSGGNAPNNYKSAQQAPQQANDVFDDDSIPF